MGGGVFLYCFKDRCFLQNKVRQSEAFGKRKISSKPSTCARGDMPLTLLLLFLPHVTQAAEQGDKEAQFNLAMMIFKGVGAPQSNTDAAAWLKKAADQGDERAQCNLASMYQEGVGVKKDNTEAAALYTTAADQGNMHAQVTLGNMYHKGQGVAKDQAAAMRWFQKAADQGITWLPWDQIACC